MDSFYLLAEASLAASKTLVQWLLVPELYFRFGRFTLLVQTKRSDFYELWQEHKQLKTMEMSKAWPDIFIEGYIYNIYMNPNLNPLIKLTRSSRSTEFKNILTWSLSQMITKADLISMRVVISYKMKWVISFWVWWKVNGDWLSWEFPNAGKAIAEQIQEIKEQRCESHSQGYE